MSDPIDLTSADPILNSLPFRPHRSNARRCVQRFVPGPDDAQTVDLRTPWGEVLTAKCGDYLVSDMDSPQDAWPVDGDIFEQTYEMIEPDVCIKRAITDLVPLTELTGGDPDQLVTVYSLEGAETVRAGDFYLARGVRGEIWAYPKKKVFTNMIPAE